MANLNINNVIKVPVKNYGGFYRAWLEYLTPLHKMSNKAKDLAACYLEERERLSQSISDSLLVDEILMGSDMKTKIKNDCNLSSSFYNLLMRDLKKSGFLNGKFINPIFIPKKVRFEDGNVSVLLFFDLKDETKD